MNFLVERSVENDFSLTWAENLRVRALAGNPICTERLISTGCEAIIVAQGVLVTPGKSVEGEYVREDIRGGGARWRNPMTGVSIQYEACMTERRRVQSRAGTKSPTKARTKAPTKSPTCAETCGWTFRRPLGSSTPVAV